MNAEAVDPTARVLEAHHMHMIGSHDMVAFVLMLLFAASCLVAVRQGRRVFGKGAHDAKKLE